MPFLTPNRLHKRQDGKRYREPNAPMFTLTSQDRHGILHSGRIRRLMPQESLRLQGFSDEQISKIMAVCSESQVYAQAGNAVTVNVVYEIALRLRKMHDELVRIKWQEGGSI